MFIFFIFLRSPAHLASTPSCSPILRPRALPTCSPGAPRRCGPFVRNSWTGRNQHSLLLAIAFFASPLSSNTENPTQLTNLRIRPPTSLASRIPTSPFCIALKSCPSRNVSTRSSCPSDSFATSCRARHRRLPHQQSRPAGFEQNSSRAGCHRRLP